MCNNNIESLLTEKEKLIQDIKQKTDELTDKKYEIKTMETNLVNNVDLKARGITNKDKRKAYLDENTLKQKHERDMLQNELSDLKRRLDLCNDKLKLFI